MVLSMGWQRVGRDQTTCTFTSLKNLPILKMLEMQFQSLSWEDPLEKGMIIYPSIIPWRIQWTDKPSGLQSIGLQRVRRN